MMCNNTVEITNYTGKATEVAIPGKIKGLPVVAIRANAFVRKQLTNINIPGSVTVIGNEAFSGNKLTSVTIPGSVTVIGDGAFDYNQLTSVIIPGSVAAIGQVAFRNNPLTSVTIPANVDIWSNSFGGNLTGYTQGGRRAGTYTSSDGGETWNRQ
jgi:hypothetical protein